jgi:hypothetical protein
MRLAAMGGPPRIMGNPSIRTRSAGPMARQCIARTRECTTPMAIPIPIRESATPPTTALIAQPATPPITGLVTPPVMPTIMGLITQPIMPPITARR